MGEKERFSTLAHGQWKKKGTMVSEQLCIYALTLFQPGKMAFSFLNKSSAHKLDPGMFIKAWFLTGGRGFGANLVLFLCLTLSKVS